MALKAGLNTKILGNATAGADGNMTSFLLPGGISTSISGIGILYPDGRQTQKIGIIPDIFVEPTIDGIRNRKDDELNKAIELVR